MAARTQLLTACIVALIGGVLLFSRPLRAAEPIPIACPNNQTVFLEGSAAPREPLLVYLGGRAVGGGLSDSAGRYRLPLRAQEKPGSYPVEVRLRANRSLVERFICFVDVPLGSEATPTPTLPAPAATTTTRPAATQPPTQPTRTAGATASPTAAGSTPTVTPTGPTATVTTTGTSGPSPTPTRTLQPGVASPTITPTPRVGAVVIDDVVIKDPAFTDSEEYVQIRNADNIDLNLAGWRILNASRSSVPAFTFPNYILEADVTIAVFSQVGNDDLEIGDFYWDQQGDVWSIGDRVELRDSRNNLIDSFEVPDQ